MRYLKATLTGFVYALPGAAVIIAILSVFGAGANVLESLRTGVPAMAALLAVFAITFLSALAASGGRALRAATFSGFAIAFVGTAAYNIYSGISASYASGVGAVSVGISELLVEFVLLLPMLLGFAFGVRSAFKR
jgi:hypothetical protein